MMYTPKLKIAVLVLLLSILIILLAAVLFEALQKQPTASLTHAGTTLSKEETTPKEFEFVAPNPSDNGRHAPTNTNKDKSHITKENLAANKDQTEVPKDTLTKETPIPNTPVIVLPIPRKEKPVAKKELLITNNLALRTGITLSHVQLAKYMFGNVYKNTSDNTDAIKLTNKNPQLYLNNTYDITTAKSLIKNHAKLLKIVKDPSLTIPDTPGDDGIANLVRNHIEHIKSALCIDETTCRTTFHNRVIMAAILENMFIKTYNITPGATMINELVTYCHTEGYHATPIKLIRRLFKKKYKKSNVISHGNNKIDCSLSMSKDPIELHYSIAGDFIIHKKTDQNTAAEAGYLLKFTITPLNESSNICYKDIKLQLIIPDTMRDCIPDDTYNNQESSSPCMYLSSKSKIEAANTTAVVYSFSDALQVPSLIDKQHFNTVCSILSNALIQDRQQTIHQ